MKIRLITALALVASMFAVTFSASAQDFEYHPIATDEFYDVWERADRPVSELVVARSWIWGPGGFTGLLTEEYAEAEGGERDVQYFDKSRQEMPLNDQADPDSPWFITQGLLATELMTGRLQLGHDTFEQHFPAMIPVAGDPDDTTGPTYAAMGTLTGFEVEESNTVITAVVDRDGAVTDNPDLADYGIFPTHYDTVTNQNVASVFWDFMTTDDAIVYENDDYVIGDLFLEPLYAVGRPTTEAYWAWVKVGDVHQWVLIQCFERRCLTYAPDNPEGWEVESGNIGQHYYTWRYHHIDRDNPVHAEDGSFTFDDESETTILVGQDVILTAQVWGEDIHGAIQTLAGITVRFEIEAGGEAFVSLDRDDGVTGLDGIALVVVTGEAEGVAIVNAFADLDGSGDFTAGVDIELGSVEVTVIVENDENNNDD